MKKKFLILLFAIFNVNLILANLENPLPFACIQELKARPEDSNENKFIHAIIGRNIEKVRKYLKTLDLNRKPIESIISGKLLTKINSNSKEKINAIHMVNTYLSIAILNSIFDGSEEEKKQSILIIKELLNNKANVNYPISAKHKTYGLGYATMVETGRNSSIPFEFFCPLIFYPVIFACRAEVLEVLFSYGARADAKLDGFNGGTTLLDCAKQTNATTLIPVITKALNTYDNFRQSKEFNYLAYSMQNLYLSLNKEERKLFIKAASDLGNIFEQYFNKLTLNTSFYLDIADESTFKIKTKNKKIKNQVIATNIAINNENETRIKEYINKIKPNILPQIKTILSEPKIKNKLLEYCKLNKQDIFFVVSLANPTEQHRFMFGNPIIEAIKIDLN